MKLFPVYLQSHKMGARILNCAFSALKYSTSSSPTHFKKVMFFGTDDFALASLMTLEKLKTGGQIGELEVITVQEQGHQLPVRKFCTQMNIPCTFWSPQTHSYDTHGCDLGVVVSFGHLLPQELISSFPLGIINVHGSLLPKWRGAAPITHAILNGDSQTGISVMRVQPHRFDVGEVLYQKDLPITEHQHCKELTATMAKLGAECLQHCLQDFDYFSKNQVPQSSEKATKAPKLKRSDARIIWSEMEGDLIKRMYYAFGLDIPLWSTFDGTPIQLLDFHDFTSTSDPIGFQGLTYKHLQFLKSLPQETTEEIEHRISTSEDKKLIVPGQVEFGRKSKLLRVACKNGIVTFKSISLKKKKRMTPSEFHNGCLSKVVYSKRYFYYIVFHFPVRSYHLFGVEFSLNIYVVVITVNDFFNTAWTWKLFETYFSYYHSIIFVDNKFRPDFISSLKVQIEKENMIHVSTCHGNKTLLVMKYGGAAVVDIF